MKGSWCTVWLPGLADEARVPLSSEDVTHMTVKARFWPWLSLRIPSVFFKLFPAHAGAGLRKAILYKKRVELNPFWQ